MTTVGDSTELSGNADGKALLAKYSRLPISRIQYFPNATPSVLNAVKRGVVFIMAFWSAPSIKAFCQLTEVIQRIDLDSILEVLVIDTDGASAFQQVPEFSCKMHGAGETAWILDGMIRTTSGIGYNPDCFLPNTIDLLMAK